jgi:multicomponent Na+:H+ antiporter subunit D
MSLTAQSPVLLVMVPFISAFVVALIGYRYPDRAQPLSVASLGVTFGFSLIVLQRVINEGIIQYSLSGWPAPYGIQYQVDHLNIIVLVAIAFVALMSAIWGSQAVEMRLPHKKPQFYALFLLLVTGLLGMTITADAFNLYVLLEISALSSYALLSLGGKRSAIATFKYLIIGTIGASFFLLGVGYLYIMTGTLNIPDLHVKIGELHGSRSIYVAFVFIMLGMFIKMALFPLHAWLPNAYAFAPASVGSLIAPLMTKVSIYVMIRMMFSVFGTEYVFSVIDWQAGMVWLASVAIVVGSVCALQQKMLKRMLTYIVVAEVGYMVGGAWLANSYGLTGAIFHILNDAIMTLCLFLFAGTAILHTNSQSIDDLKGLYRRMPFTMAAFTVGAMSMIGIPPTCGFFSKGYLILGALEAGQLQFMAALLFSSLVNAVLFFRIIEKAYFEPWQDHHAHGDKAPKPVKIKEAPLNMLLPLLITAAVIIAIGLGSGVIVETFISQFVQATGL